MVPGLRDNEDLLVERLGRLVDVLETKEFGDTTVERSVTQNIDRTRTDSPNNENQPIYFSTGPEAIAVENTEEWERLDFGIVAETVNIRTTDDIDIAFADPNKNGPVIRVREGESPFTIGGDAGIESAFIWLRQAETASNTPGIQIIAFN
ncbi:head protein [Haloarcula hispanica virus SH1]|uniref:ORF 31 n=2 Tax=Haloarcula hispanica SH1 virus TaxID=326574 RepID=Q4KPF6_9VIRU|nr:head protein [Haloarcula hispanica virus SH1]AAY24957.1 ORF 31 [Haloarcula hispanica virus SH1]